MQKGARGWGQEGWAKWGGTRGWHKGGQEGWNLYINEVLNKTGIISSNYGVGTHVPRRNRMKSEGFPHFRGIPIVITSRSRKYVIISPKKVQKRDVQEISSNYLCRRTSHLGKLKKMPHFEISNSNIKAIRQPIGPKLEI